MTALAWLLLGIYAGVTLALAPVKYARTTRDMFDTTDEDNAMVIGLGSFMAVYLAALFAAAWPFYGPFWLLGAALKARR